MMSIVRGRVFRPSIRGLVLALCAVAIGIALGNWQMRRAGERHALAAQHDAAVRAPAIEIPATPVGLDAFAGRRVSASGRFDEARTRFLEYRSRRGRFGYEVLTPLKVGAGSMHVLVNRGWVAAGASPGEPPAVSTPAGEVRLEGIALVRLPRFLEAGAAQPQDRVRQNYGAEEFAAETGLPVQPFIVEQWSDTGDGLDRNWPRADSGAQKNEMYAFQWYSLAALAAVIYVVLSFRRAPPAG